MPRIDSRIFTKPSWGQLKWEISREITDIDGHNTQARQGCGDGDLDKCLEMFAAERGCNHWDFSLARENLKEWMYEDAKVVMAQASGSSESDQASGSSDGVRASGSSRRRSRSPSRRRSRSPSRRWTLRPPDAPPPSRRRSRSPSGLTPRLTPRPPDAPPPWQAPTPPSPPPAPPPLPEQQRPFRAFGGQGVEGIGWCRSCAKWRSECFQRYDWECERCGNHNYATKRACMRCGDGRSAFQIYPDGTGSDGKKVDIDRVCASHQCPMLECFLPFDWMCWCGSHNFSSKMVLSG